MTVTLAPEVALEPFSELPPGTFAALGDDELLRAIEAVERLKAWVDYVGLTAVGELDRRTRSAAVDRLGPDASDATRERAARSARSAAADEVVLATGLAYPEVLARIEVADGDPARVGALVDRLRDGTSTWHRVRTLAERCAPLPPDQAAEIGEAVLAPVRGGAALTDTLFRQRLNRRLARRIELRESREEALRRRALWVRVDPDGTGALTLTGGAVRLQGAYERVDSIARQLRAAGHCRTLSQLRSDVALDLMLFGHLDGSDTPAAGTSRAVLDSPATSGASPATRWVDGPHANGVTPAGTQHASVPASEHRSDAPAPCGPGTDTEAALLSQRAAARARRLEGITAGQASSAFMSQTYPHTGADPGGFAPDSTARSFDPTELGTRLPAASVHVVIALSTLLGLDHEPGQLTTATSVEPLDADIIRDAAMTAGGTWRRLVTDPLDGTAVELSSKAYRPGPRLRRAVRARDRVCRAPGCTVPAGHSDIDHDHDYHDGGATDLGNTTAKHRRHHNHKTSRQWRTDRDTSDPAGPVMWTTATGRTYSSHPYDYRPLAPERTHSVAETAIVQLLKPVEFLDDVEPWRPDTHDLRHRPPTHREREALQDLRSGAELGIPQTPQPPEVDGGSEEPPY